MPSTKPASHPVAGFTRFAKWTAHATGRPTAFLFAALTIIVWGATGPAFHYSDTWQLVINTGTTIVTFLMVFLIQNTQNRDSQALHLKIDEVIRAIEGARNSVIDLDCLSDEEMEELRVHYTRLAEKAKNKEKERRDRRAPARAGR